MSPGFLMGITSPHDFAPSNAIPDDSDDEDMFFYDARVSLDDEILASFGKPTLNNVSDDGIFYDAQSTLPSTATPTDLSSFLLSFLPSILYTLFIGLIMSDFTCIFYSLFTLQILIRSLESFEVWWNNLIGLCLPDGIRMSPQCFAYPRCYLILSCVMLSMSFVWFLGWNTAFGLCPLLLLTRKPLPLQTSKPKIVTTSKPCFNTTTCSSFLALVSALGILNDLPVVISSSIQQHQTCLLKCVSSQGLVQPSLLQNPVTISALK